MEKATQKKPWYKRWKVWVGVFAVMYVLGLFVPEDGDVSEDAAKPAERPATSEPKDKAAAPSEEEIAAKVKADQARAEQEKAEWEAQNEAKKVAAAKAKEEKAAAEKAQKDSEADALQSIIKVSEGVIVDIVEAPFSDDWEIVHVIVSDAWYASPEHEKERFADTVGASIKAALDDKPTFVHFYDAYNKELATEKMFGGYKIKR